MKLGFLTGNLDEIEKSARIGFTGIELQVGAFGDPVAGPLESDKVEFAVRKTKEFAIEVTALAFYGGANAVAPGADFVALYGKAFDVAERLGVTTITSMSGFDPSRDWAGNVALFADKFGPVAELAEKRGLRVAFENWMGYWGRVPFKPCNMGGSPDTWDDWFKAVPSRALGIEFDPSHLYWQGIDHIRALKEYGDRVYHVHAKDTEMLPEKRYRGGVNGDYFRFRIPGYGEINWAQFITALQEIGYDGGVAIEHEDPIYSGSRFDEGLVRGYQVLNPLIAPTRG